MLQTILACEDAIRAEDSDPEIGGRPSLLMCPRIDLVLQNAMEWRVWEQSRKGQNARRYYYAVCSAGDGAASTSLRVITCTGELGQVLERHREEGTLASCRFFTTVEGGGLFWMEARKFAIAAGHGPDHPVFGVFVRDEVHVMCGPNTAKFTYGLNVPALYCVSYTATPMFEDRRTKQLEKAAKKHARRVARQLDILKRGAMDNESDSEGSDDDTTSWDEDV
jgi:hypothetical protein